MKEITRKELAANFTLLRSDPHDPYIYELYKDDTQYFTVCHLYDNITIQPVGEINPELPLNQEHIDYINAHSLIHINPQKHVPRWRD